MSLLVSALVVLLVGALAVLLLGEWRASRRLVWVGKPLASAAFVALPFALGGPSGSAGWALGVGLAFSFVGDLALVPEDPRAFRIAIFAFLLAHVMYAVGFVLVGVSSARTIAALVLLSVSGVLVTRWFLPGVPAQLRLAVIAYVLVISLMVMLAFSAWGAGAPWWLPVAAVAFYVSDITVARHRFVRKEPLNRLVGLPLYYGAQVGFALLAAMAR